MSKETKWIKICDLLNFKVKKKKSKLCAKVNHWANKKENKQCVKKKA